MKTMLSPWRSDYVSNLKDKKPNQTNQSIFSNIPPEEDEEKFVLYRGEHSFIIMNLYPYNAGHLMVVPYEQTPSISDLNTDTRLEIMNLIDLSIKALTKILHPQGFNVGLNIGEVSGGSISEHLHFHIVPRWNGDTNFMPILAETKVVSVDMKKMYVQLKSILKEITSASKN